MVAEQRNHATDSAQGDYLLEHPAAVRLAVDVVAQKDQRIPCRRLHGVHEPRQGYGAAMNVADGDGSFSHRWGGSSSEKLNPPRQRGMDEIACTAPAPPR